MPPRDNTVLVSLNSSEKPKIKETLPSPEIVHSSDFSADVIFEAISRFDIQRVKEILNSLNSE